jgi:hypothetical protein
LKAHILYQLIDAIVNVPSDFHPLRNIYTASLAPSAATP